MTNLRAGIKRGSNAAFQTGRVGGNTVVRDRVEYMHVEVDQTGDDEQVLGVDGLAGLGVDRFGQYRDLVAIKGEVEGRVEVLGGVDHSAVADQ